MSSILNSISSGDLQVQETPRDHPIKEDSIIELLENSEIEFETQQKPEKELPNFEQVEFIVEEPQKEIKEEFILEISQPSEIEPCPELLEGLEDINTGFGKDNDLHFETKCKLPELKTPLYRENYLQEFLSEEEKAAARHALGLYNKGDIVAMSLLTAEDNTPSKQELREAETKQLRKGDKFFVPYTLTKAVFDSDGNSIDVKINTLQETINSQKKQITALLQPSNKKELTTLGDVNLFLKGFNNGDNLKTIIKVIDEEMLRFNTTGTII